MNESGRYDNLHGDEDEHIEIPEYCDEDEYLWREEC